MAGYKLSFVDDVGTGSLFVAGVAGQETRQGFDFSTGDWPWINATTISTEPDALGTFDLGRPVKVHYQWRDGWVGDQDYHGSGLDVTDYVVGSVGPKTIHMRTAWGDNAGGHYSAFTARAYTAFYFTIVADAGVESHNPVDDSSIHEPNDIFGLSCVIKAGYALVSADMNGTDITGLILGGLSVSMPSADVTVTIVTEKLNAKVTGNVTVLPSTCPFVGMKYLDGPAVSGQIAVDSNVLPNGGVDIRGIGDTPKIDITTNAPSTRLVSVKVDGVEKVTPNISGMSFVLPALTGDVDIQVVIKGDRFCWVETPTAPPIRPPDGDPPIVIEPEPYPRPEPETGELDFVPYDLVSGHPLAYHGGKFHASVGQEVVFRGVNAAAPFVWDLDDSATSTEEFPVHAYPVGDYTITLDATIADVMVPHGTASHDLLVGSQEADPDWFPVDSVSGIPLPWVYDAFLGYLNREIRFVPVNTTTSWDWMLEPVVGPTSTLQQPVNTYTGVPRKFDVVLDTFDELVAAATITHPLRLIAMDPNLDTAGIAAFLLIRWKNDSGEWGKWREIVLGTTRPEAILNRMGLYATRQYEVAMMASLPQVIAYIEEEVVLTDA